MRRTAVAVALALLAGGAWWIVRGPMVDEPGARLPEAAVDPAFLNGSRVAASSSAPVEPLKPAAASPASAPTRAASDARCGDDQRPEYGAAQKGSFVVPILTKPASLAYTAAQARIDAALRASADPFDRAVADLVNVGDMRSPAGVLDALVQDALATSDARIYSLAYIACVDADARTGFPVGGPPPPHSCASLSVRRWAQLEPDNGVPWLAAVQEAQLSKDAAEQEDVLAHLALATRFDGRLHAAAGAVLQRASINADEAAAVSDLANRAIALNPVGSTLRALCDSKRGADKARRAQCAAIATTMFEHTDSEDLRAQAARLTSLATGDASRIEIERAERERVTSSNSEETAMSTCDAERRRMTLILRSSQVGEVKAMRELVSSAPTKP